MSAQTTVPQTTAGQSSTGNVTLAAPSFSRMIKSNSMASGVNTFMSDLRYARSEAEQGPVPRPRGPTAGAMISASVLPG